MNNKEKSKYATKRNDLEKQADRELIKDLRLRRLSTRQIATHPDLSHISHSQVYADLKLIEANWKSTTSIDLDKKKQEQLETLDFIIRESSEAWEKSKADKVKKSIKNKDDFKGKSKESGIQTETIHGDHNYMKRVLDALTEQNKILGLHAPVKAEVSGKADIVISFKESNL